MSIHVVVVHSVLVLRNLILRMNKKGGFFPHLIIVSFIHFWTIENITILKDKIGLEKCNRYRLLIVVGK